VKGATLDWPYSGDVRAVDRRLTLAIGASLVIHALVVASLRGLTSPLPAQDAGIPTNFATLQAVLAGPRTEVKPPEPAPPEAPTPPALFLPPLRTPVETATRRTQPALAPPPGPVQRSGTDRPPVSISVKLIDDPTRLGTEYALALAQKFPRRAAKPPGLLGSLSVAYPRAALDAGAEGSVAALLTLDAQGHVVDATLLPEGGMFAPAVADALKTAAFAPAESDGKAIPYWAIVEFFFTIAHPSAPPAR
jgi:outer membrane biosynthesis protein TonB